MSHPSPSPSPYSSTHPQGKAKHIRSSPFGKALHKPSEYMPDLYDHMGRGEGDPSRLIEVPDIRQPDDYSCGAAAAMSVGKYWGVGPDSLKEWKKALGTNRGTSTHPFVIREYLKSLELQVEDAENMSLEDLHGYWERGMPVICMIQEWGNPLEEGKHEDEPKRGEKPQFAYGHFCVSLGVSLGYVFVQDPSMTNVIDESNTDTHGLPDELVSLAVEFLDEMG